MSVLLLVACGILRSTDLFFRVPTIAALPVVTIVAWEHLINAVVLLPLFLWKFPQWQRVSGRDLILLLLVGWGASVGGILSFTQAFTSLNPALVILLQKLQPLITIGLGWKLLGERPARIFWPWALLSIVCAYFVGFSTTNPFTDEWRRVASGMGFAVLAACFWGGGTTFGKELLTRYDAGFVLVNRITLGAILTLFLVWWTGNGLATPVVLSGSSPQGWNLLYMALIPGLLATASFYGGLGRISAAVSSILELAFPLSSALIMWLWFNRPLDTVQILAAVGLCVGMTMVSRTVGTAPVLAHPPAPSQLEKPSDIG
jgi:drug/metabolite transporter (DMT)-like permease